MENLDRVIVEGLNQVAPAGETYYIDGQEGGTVEHLEEHEIVTYPDTVESLIVNSNEGNDVYWQFDDWTQ